MDGVVNDPVLRALRLTMANFVDHLPVVDEWSDVGDKGPAKPIEGW